MAEFCSEKLGTDEFAKLVAKLLQQRIDACSVDAVNECLTLTRDKAFREHVLNDAIKSPELKTFSESFPDVDFSKFLTSLILPESFSESDAVQDSQTHASIFCATSVVRLLMRLLLLTLNDIVRQLPNPTPEESTLPNVPDLNNENKKTISVVIRKLTQFVKQSKTNSTLTDPNKRAFHDGLVLAFNALEDYIKHEDSTTLDDSIMPPTKSCSSSNQKTPSRTSNRWKNGTISNPTFNVAPVSNDNDVTSLITTLMSALSALQGHDLFLIIGEFCSEPRGRTDLIEFFELCKTNMKSSSGFTLDVSSFSKFRFDMSIGTGTLKKLFTPTPTHNSSLTNEHGRTDFVANINKGLARSGGLRGYAHSIVFIGWILSGANLCAIAQKLNRCQPSANFSVSFGAYIFLNVMQHITPKTNLSPPKHQK
jgi:hypothetical protein